MLSSTDRWPRTTLEGMDKNMVADGLFHLATWALVVVGVWALWLRESAGLPKEPTGLVADLEKRTRRSTKKATSRSKTRSR